MDYNNIRELLEKYWKGETEVAEEKILKEFFSQSDLPDDFEIEKPLFGYIKQEENSPVLYEDFTEKLRKQWEGNKVPVKKMPLWKQRVKNAAILVPVLVLGYFLVNRNQRAHVTTPVQTDSFSDPQKALAETEKTLLLLSQNMSDGLSTLEAFKLFDEVKKSGKLNEQKTPFPTK